MHDRLNDRNRLVRVAMVGFATEASFSGARLRSDERNCGQSDGQKMVLHDSLSFPLRIPEFLVLSSSRSSNRSSLCYNSLMRQESISPIAPKFFSEIPITTFQE